MKKIIACLFTFVMMYMMGISVYAVGEPYTFVGNPNLFEEAEAEETYLGWHPISEVQIFTKVNELSGVYKYSSTYVKATDDANVDDRKRAERRQFKILSEGPDMAWSYQMSFGNPDCKWADNMTHFQIEGIKEGRFRVYLDPSKGYVCVVQEGKALELLIRFHSRDEDPINFVKPTLANILSEGYLRSDTELIDADYVKFVNRCVEYDKMIYENSGFSADLYVNNKHSSIRCMKGDKLNLKVNAKNGAGDYTYKYAVLDVESGKWSVIKNFGSNNTLIYIADSAGIKQFAVTVKDKTGKTVATERVRAYVTDDVSGSLTVNNSKSSVVRELGSSILLEANAKGGYGDYTYKFAMLDVNTGKWTILKEFDWRRTYICNLSSTGIKQFAVTIKDRKGNTVSTNRIKVNVVYKLVGELKVNNSTEDVMKKVGGKITLNANGTGGSGSYTYKFAVLNTDTGKWSVLRNFNSNSSYTYTLKYLGIKQFGVTVKDSSGITVATNRITVNVVKDLPKPSAKLTVDGSTAKIVRALGERITLDVTAEGGIGNYTYKFAMLDVETGEWTVLSDFYSIPSCRYYFNTTGNKQFAVTVKDSEGSTVATNRISVKVVEKKLTAKVYCYDNNDSEISYIGDTIDINVSASGGSSEYKYKFMRYDANTGKKVLLQDYSDKYTYVGELPNVGDNVYIVYVKDADGVVVSIEYVIEDVKSEEGIVSKSEAYKMAVDYWDYEYSDDLVIVKDGIIVSTNGNTYHAYRLRAFVEDHWTTYDFLYINIFTGETTYYVPR